MDKLAAMNLLREVVDRGSLSGAARSLGMPVPTVSRRLTELEKRLGAKLLIRTTRRITLTDAGEVYLGAARRILDLMADAEREATGEFSAPKGELSITAPVHFGRLHVLPIVVDFLKENPEINVRLTMADRTVNLVEDRIDMAVRIGRLPDSTLIATRVGAIRTVVCASPAILDAHGIPRSPSELANLPCLAADALSPPGHSGWPFAGANGFERVALLNLRLVTTTTDAAAKAAVDGLGFVRLLHYQVAEAVERGALVIVLADHEVEVAPVHLVHAMRGSLPLKLRRFIDFATHRLRARLDRLSGVTPAP